MKKKHSFFLWIPLFIFLTTYSINSNQNNKNIFLPIKTIKINGIVNSDEEEIREKFNIFKGKNLFFLNRRELKETVKEFQLIKEVKIKKIYPNRIEIKISEFKPLGYLVKKNKKLLFLEGGGLIENYPMNNLKNLPLIAGNGSEKYFYSFYKSLNVLNFEINLIKEFNFFLINRWDILLKDGKTIKLPNENYENAIKKFLSIYKDNSFKDFSIFDFRIEGQLILK